MTEVELHNGSESHVMNTVLSLTFEKISPIAQVSMSKSSTRYFNHVLKQKICTNYEDTKELLTLRTDI